MIIAMTEFALPQPMTPQEAREVFVSTAPTCRGIQGLFQKHYVAFEDGLTVGGIYLWNSRPDECASDKGHE